MLERLRTVVRRREGTPAPRRRGLADAALTCENAFDVVRLAAAGLVLFSHSFALAGHREPFAGHTLGTAGVEIFFATSGFLVTRSWLADPSPARFFAKRALRVMPALAVAVLVTAFVIGPIFSTLSTSAYLLSSEPWHYSFENIRLRTAYVLGSVFSGNPNGAANGSLWSLPLEVYAYGLLAQAALCGAFRSRRALVGAYLFLVYWTAVFPPGLNARLFCLFLAGGILYARRDLVRLRWDVALVLAGLWVHLYTTRYAAAAGVVALPYLVVFAAYRLPHALRRLTKLGDVSYGVYLYAFPIQQAIVAAVGAIAPLALFGLAAPLVWLTALGSSHLVERPALSRKPRTRTQAGSDEAVGASAARRRAPAAMPEPAAP